MCYNVAVADSGLNKEILQFDWFISDQIFPILPAQGGFKNPLFNWVFLHRPRTWLISNHYLL